MKPGGGDGMSSKAPRASLSAEAASFVPLAGGAATEGATSTRAAGARAAGEPAGASPEPVSAAVAAGGAEADRGAGEQDAGAAEDGDGDVETADGRDRPTRLGSAARRNARRRRMVNRVKSERDGLEGYVAALTSGRPFVPVPVAVPVVHHAAPPVLVVPPPAFAAMAAVPQAPPLLPLPPPTGVGHLSSMPQLCRSRAVLSLPPIVITYEHALARWPWLPGLGPPRPRSAHGNAAAEATERAVRGAVTSAFRDSFPDVVLWAVALDSGLVRWVSDNVTSALGYAPAALLGVPYMADGHVEDNIKFLSEITLLLETQGELPCMPRRLFRRRHAFGHEVLVSCCGSVFVQDPVSGELVGLVANRIVAALH